MNALEQHAVEDRTVAQAPSPTATRSSGRRRWPWIVGLLIVLGGIASRELSLRHAAAATRSRDAGARPVPVAVARARTGDLPVYLRGLGTVTALKTVTIKSRVDGQLVRVPVQEGQTVREGELLAEIDPRPFDVQRAQAEGQLARDQAALQNAQVDLQRDQALVNEKILPQQQLDAQRAQVAQFQGSIRSDEAQVANARLQLTYSRITAPFSGRVGLRQVDPGNIVHANDQNGLFVLTQVHPITVVFSLPQDDLAEVLSKLRSGTPLEVEAYDRDNTTRIATGKLLTTDNQIDPTTGTYKLKAQFENQDDALFPNQFVNVRLHLDTRRGLVVVPTVAVQRGSSGPFVYVVGSDGTAHVHPVTIDLTEGANTGMSAGVKPGETVVVDGQDKLQDGSKVDVATRGGGTETGGTNGGGANAGGSSGPSPNPAAPNGGTTSTGAPTSRPARPGGQ
jgi:multidrug efflux system membrane fusion protein